MSEIKTLRSYVKEDQFAIWAADYEFRIQSVVKGAKEARQLQITRKVQPKGIMKCEDALFTFTADGFIDYYKEHRLSGMFADSSMSIWKLGNDYISNQLKDQELSFPITIIFQIVLFIVMELYRYWRDKKRYEELEDIFHDNITTYTDYEYCKAKEVDWND